MTRDHSQAPEQASIRYPRPHVFEIASRFVRQTFRIHVARPPVSGHLIERLPVLYTGDANLFFPVFRGLSLGLGPRFILVAIGYPSDMPLAGARLRARDFTFPGYPELGLGPSPIEGVLMPEPGSKAFGGAEDFLEFLSAELIPQVEAWPDVYAMHRGYFGHSGGAGLGLYALCTRPQLFSRFILSSPGLSFDGVTPGGIRYENYDFVTSYLVDRKARGGVPADTRLYLSAGADEDGEATLAAWRLTSNVRRMAHWLDQLTMKGLTLTSEIHLGETHDTVWPVAFSKGVRWAYGGLAGSHR